MIPCIEFSLDFIYLHREIYTLSSNASEYFHFISEPKDWYFPSLPYDNT